MKHFYKKILAAFFLLLLVCTFFSKTIYNINLPQAAVAFPKQGELKHDISGSGEIRYKNVWGVYAPDDGRIEEIRVKKGDQAAAGDVLLVLKKQGGEGTVEVKAPKAGRILALDVQEGMFVSATQNEPLAEMAEFTGVWQITFPIEEQAAAEVALGCQASLEVPGILGQVDGCVFAVDCVEQEDTRKYQAVIEFSCQEEGIAGRRAGATIRREGEVLNGIVPSYALHKDQKGYYVWTVKEEDNILGRHYIVQRLSVDLLDTDEEAAAVLGLGEKQPVVVSCTEELAEGTRIAYGEDGK